MFFFFKQKTAYEMRISDWSSDVCSSDLSAFVETVRPVAQRLTIHAADRSRLLTTLPGVDRRQRQKTPDLAGIATASGERPKPAGIVIVPKLHARSHGESSLATLQSDRDNDGHPPPNHTNRPLVSTRQVPSTF